MCKECYKTVCSYLSIHFLIITREKIVLLRHNPGNVSVFLLRLFFPLYNFTNATRAGRSCINLFILASLSILVLFFLYMLPFLLDTSKTLLKRVCSVEINLKLHSELSLKLSACPSVHHPPIKLLFTSFLLGRSMTLVRSPA